MPNLKRHSLETTLIILSLFALTACGGGNGSGSVDAGSVSAAGLGSVTLNWTPPTTRADGGALSLSEIAGYRVLYGTEPGQYTHSLDINDAASNSATIADLPLGDYYFVLVTRDTNGSQSGLSNMVSRTAI